MARAPRPCLRQMPLFFSQCQDMKKTQHEGQSRCRPIIAWKTRNEHAILVANLDLLTVLHAVSLLQIELDTLAQPSLLRLRQLSRLSLLLLSLCLSSIGFLSLLCAYGFAIRLACAGMLALIGPNAELLQDHDHRNNRSNTDFLTMHFSSGMSLF